MWRQYSFTISRCLFRGLQKYWENPVCTYCASLCNVLLFSQHTFLSFLAHLPISTADLWQHIGKPVTAAAQFISRFNFHR